MWPTAHCWSLFQQPSAGHQLTLLDHRYGAHASCDVAVYFPSIRRLSDYRLLLCDSGTCTVYTAFQLQTCYYIFCDSINKNWPIRAILGKFIYKVKGKCIAVCINNYTATGNHLPYGITQCHLPPGRGDFPPLPQPKLVLDLATPKGCKAELT